MKPQKGSFVGSRFSRNYVADPTKVRAKNLNKRALTSARRRLNVCVDYMIILLQGRLDKMSDHARPATLSRRTVLLATLRNSTIAPSSAPVSRE